MKPYNINCKLKPSMTKQKIQQTCKTCVKRARKHLDEDFNINPPPEVVEADWEKTCKAGKLWEKYAADVIKQAEILAELDRNNAYGVNHFFCWKDKCNTEEELEARCRSCIKGYDRYVDYPVTITDNHANRLNPPISECRLKQTEFLARRQFWKEEHSKATFLQWLKRNTKKALEYKELLKLIEDEEECDE